MRQIAGQEAEPLAGFDRGPHEHDAPHGVARERFDGRGHREIGLAGAGGPDAEREIGFAHRFRISDLVRAARAHRAAARVDDETAFGAVVGQIGTQVLGERQMHSLAIELLGFGEIEQILEHAAAALGGEIGPGQLEAVASVVDPDAELPLDLPQVLVELPAYAREAPRVVGGQHNRERRRDLRCFRQRISLSRH